MSRRELVGTLAASALLKGAETPATFAVIGAGVFGAWTALALRRSGHQVTLLDQYGAGSSRASSGGETRIIRASYGPDEVYTRMAQRSLKLWSTFFAQTGRPLLHRTGVLWMAKAGNPYVNESRKTLGALQVPFEDLSTSDLKRLYPQIQIEPGTIAIFETESGALMARQAVQAVVDQFVSEGGIYRHTSVHPPASGSKLTAVVTSDGESIAADGYVFACGPWLGKIFPQILGRRIFPTRQDVLFFGVPSGDRRFEPPHMPVWIDFSDNRGMYGFPDIENRGFKVAFDLHGPPFDPDNGNRTMSEEQIAAARAYLKDRFPALANAPVTETRVCQYENTANGDFVIDQHPDWPQVWLVGGGSGHGFKHGPAVGEYAAARVTGDSSIPVEPRFSLASKGTEQKRAVY